MLLKSDPSTHLCAYDAKTPEETLFNLIHDFFNEDVSTDKSLAGTSRSRLTGTILVGGTLADYQKLLQKITISLPDGVNVRNRGSEFFISNKSLKVMHEPVWHVSYSAEGHRTYGTHEKYSGLQGHFCIIYGYTNIHKDMLRYLSYRSRFSYNNTLGELQAPKFYIIV